MNAITFDDDEIERLRQRIEAVHAQQVTGLAPLGLVPLKLSCWMASCKHGRHCLDYLRRPHKGCGRVQPGQCRDCGQPIVDFCYNTPESITDECEHIAHQVLDQQSELIRAHYWHVPIDQWAYNSARRLGKEEVRRRVERRVIAALAEPGAYNGRSAPYSKDIIAYAQHATATCCRRCASYWHGLPSDAAVRPSAAQLRHAVTIALTWLDIRLPDLPVDPDTAVPVIRKDDLPARNATAALDDKLLNAFGAGADPAGLVMPVHSAVHVSDTRGSLLLLRELDLQV
ncbi:DUF4186 family protein [Mycolicibacterium mageritense]|uniref:DUF4186 family protein n=1 Tax=Mycolicibacterium mageritense TaxID=53462 RepID=UPI001E3A1195|nr:DUF4186 family protein [Mycolicibacterium mageritense]GJJ16328.1 hypothetical protein MTY414_00010 [Mycolicibacterium mageritense]